MRRVRRLGFLDGLTVALVVLLVGALAMIAGPVLVPTAYAKTIWSYNTCQAPATCPGTSGLCTGCVAGANMSGLCSTDWVYYGCSGLTGNCLGAVGPTPCNCSSNAC